MARTSTSFQKGVKPGPGRPKGKKNRLTLAMKEIINEATHLAGDELVRQRIETAKRRKQKAPAPSKGGALEYLTTMALTEPKAFLSVLGRTLEKSVNVKLGQTPTVIFRDFTGVSLEKLGPSVLRRIEQLKHRETP